MDSMMENSKVKILFMEIKRINWINVMTVKKLPLLLILVNGNLSLVV